MPFSVPPPSGKYIGGWRSLDGAAIAIDKVAGRSGAGDLQHPDEVVDAVAAVVLAPAQIVQRGGGIEPQRCPAAVGDERIEAGAFIDLVEMRQRAAGVKLLAVSVVRPGDARCC